MAQRKFPIFFGNFAIQPPFSLVISYPVVFDYQSQNHKNSVHIVPAYCWSLISMAAPPPPNNLGILYYLKILGTRSGELRMINLRQDFN